MLNLSGRLWLRPRWLILLLIFLLSTSSLVFLLLEHELNLRLGELLSLILIVFVFNLLLAAFYLKGFSFFVFIVIVAILRLLENANLVSKLLKVLLLYNLIEMFFGERELFWVFFILFLKVLQKKLLFGVVKLIKIH